MSIIASGNTINTGLTYTADQTGNLAITAVNALTLQTGSNTATLPAATGTVMVSGNMPTFSVYLSANQNITTNTDTKVLLDTKEFDTATCFNTSTSRFTPTVAGYYQISAVVYGQNSVNTQSLASCAIWKNGALFKQSNFVFIGGGGAINYQGNAVSSIIYFNGTTDYIELYGINTGTSPKFVGGSTYTYLSGALVRTA